MAYGIINDTCLTALADKLRYRLSSDATVSLMHQYNADGDQLDEGDIAIADYICRIPWSMSDKIISSCSLTIADFYDRNDIGTVEVKFLSINSSHECFVKKIQLEVPKSVPESPQISGIARGSYVIITPVNRRFNTESEPTVLGFVSDDNVRIYSSMISGYADSDMTIYVRFED